MKVGDRVFADKMRNHPGYSGYGTITETEFNDFGFTDGIVVDFDFDNKQFGTRVCHKVDLIPESVYSSKLYKIIK